MKKPNAAVAGPSGDDKGYQAESDLRTLIEAQKIMSDKGRIAAAMAKHGEMKGNLDAVQEAAPAPSKKVSRPKPTANLGAF
jgi:hypothetical protein